MRSAFLVIIADEDRPVAQRHRALTADPAPGGLGFDAAGHGSWADETSRAVIGAWQDASLDGPRPSCRWVGSAESFTAVVGGIRSVGQAWDDEGSWAAAVRDLVRTPRRPAAARRPQAMLGADLRGTYAVTHWRRGGEGFVGADPLGLRFLYVAAGDGVMAVATRAALAAAAVAPPGARPRRDALGVLWNAAANFRVGRRTGFEGVRLLGPGEQVSVRPGVRPTIDCPERPWEPERALLDASTAEVVAVARAELADDLRAAPSLAAGNPGSPSARVAADLTGGKDSRLLLAVALAEGVEGRFAYQTVGPSRLPDVVVAAELAARYGLDHRRRSDIGRHTADYPERFARFVEDSGGMRNAWLLKGALDRPPAVRVSGVDGYLIRSKLRADERLLGAADLDIWIARLTADVIGAVRPEAVQVLRDELREELEPPGTGELSLEDRVDILVQSNSSRHLLGLLEELEQDRRVLPFTSPRLVRAGWALGGEQRRREVLFTHLLADVDPWLLEHRLASGAWKTADRSAALPLSERGFTVPAARRSTPVDPAGGSFGSFLNRSGAQHRRQVVDAALHGAADAVWEVVDRRATMGALSDYEVLTKRARRQLFGIATMAQWLSSGG